MQLSHFDLNLLRSLDALLQKRNVTHAAEAMCVTQQAMSGSLKRLRQHFGDDLLIRVGRHLELTPLAKALEVPIRETLLHIQATLDITPGFDPALLKRNFKISMTDYAAVVVLPWLLRRVMASSPSVTIDIESFNADSFGKLERGELDFCLYAGNKHLYGNRKPSPRIKSALLFRDDFVCVVDETHFPCGSELTRERYTEARHNVVKFGPNVMTLVERGWLQQHFYPNIVASAPSFTSLIFMVPGTPLVATAQRRLARSLVAALNLSVFEAPVKIPHVEECLAWHSREELDPAHNYLRELIVDAAKGV